MFCNQTSFIWNFKYLHEIYGRQLRQNWYLYVQFVNYVQIIHATHTWRDLKIGNMGSWGIGLESAKYWFKKEETQKIPQNL